MENSFHIQCEVCDTKLCVSQESRGLAVRCPHCEHVQHVPARNEESLDDTAVENPTSSEFVENLSKLIDDKEIPCPNCEAVILAGETVCNECGYNTETGMTFSQGASAYKTPHRSIPMPAFVVVTLGTLADILRMLSPRGVHPTVTGTGMLFIMTLIVCGGGFYLSNSITGKAKHLRVRIVTELEVHLNKEFPGKIDPNHIRVIDPVNITLAKTTGIQDRVRYTADLTIVSMGQRKIVGTVQGIFDSGLLFYHLELTQTVLTTEFHLYPDFIDQLIRADKRRTNSSRTSASLQLN